MLTLDIVMRAFEYAPTHMNPLFIHQNTACDTLFVSICTENMCESFIVNKSKTRRWLVIDFESENVKEKASSAIRRSASG